MPLTSQELMEIKALRGRRDHAAFMVGVATAEWRRAVAGAEKIIRESEHKEKLAGPRILRAHGFDPDSGEFTFDVDQGRILRLVQKDGTAKWADAESGDVVSDESEWMMR